MKSVSNRNLHSGKPDAGRILLIVALALLLATAVWAVVKTHGGASPSPSAASVQPVLVTPGPDGEAAPPEDGTPLLQCWFVDVGQGDCMLLLSPGGRTMLVDAGEAGNFGRIKYLADSLGITRFDVVVATHGHSDHIGSMAEVVRQYDIGAFYLSPYPSDSAAYAVLLRALEAKGIKARTAQASMTSLIPWDRDAEVRIVSPFDADYEDANEASVALNITYGATGVFLAADTGALAERLMCKALPNHLLKSAVLKLGHHGSYSSTTEKFLDAVDPLLAVACCGMDNEYGHPDPAVAALLEKRGVPLMTTAQEGTIHITLDGTAVRVVE